VPQNTRTWLSRTLFRGFPRVEEKVAIGECFDRSVDLILTQQRREQNNKQVDRQIQQQRYQQSRPYTPPPRPTPPPRSTDYKKR
jgi:hypothetical protein